MTINYFEYYLMIKYVDDVYVFLQWLNNVMRYNQEMKAIEWHEDDKIYDDEEGHTADYVTMNVFKDMASDIYPFLQFKTDTATDLYQCLM